MMDHIEDALEGTSCSECELTLALDFRWMASY
jgi:hypothetical protein